jgi:hypothetical protein
MHMRVVMVTSVLPHVCENSMENPSVCVYACCMCFYVCLMMCANLCMCTHTHMCIMCMYIWRCPDSAHATGFLLVGVYACCMCLYVCLMMCPNTCMYIYIHTCIYYILYVCIYRDALNLLVRLVSSIFAYLRKCCTCIKHPYSHRPHR